MTTHDDTTTTRTDRPTGLGVPGRRRARAVTWAAGVSAAALLLAGCGADETAVQEAQEEGPAAVAAVLGEPVTITSEVQEVINFHAFTVGENATLVLSDEPQSVTEGQEVEATGTVRQFVVPDFEGEFDWVDTGTDPWPDDYADDLVLVADTVRVLD